MAARPQGSYRAERRNFLLRNPDPDIRAARATVMRRFEKQLFESVTFAPPKGYVRKKPRKAVA